MKYTTRVAATLLVCIAASVAYWRALPSTALADAQVLMPQRAVVLIAHARALSYAALAAAQPRMPPPASVARTHASSHAALTVPPAHASSCATSAPPRATTDAVVVQPRLTGYFVGDLLTQRVLLERDGRPLTPATPPATSRVSAWFERRGARVVTDAALHRWLVVEYQILNAPPKLLDVKLPAWQLSVTMGASVPPTTLRVPAVLINIAPLSLPGSPEQVGTRDLRPDRVSPAIPLAPIRRALTLSSVALALTLLAWIAWVLWRNRRALATQPFARALREMRALDDREPRAWQALHRAFDRTAGRVIQSTTLPVLFAKAPQLTPARLQIEAFFHQSNLLFFGSGPAPRTNATPDSANSGAAIAEAHTGPFPVAPRSAAQDHAAPSISPHAVCAQLRRIERSQES